MLPINIFLDMIVAFILFMFPKSLFNLPIANSSSRTSTESTIENKQSSQKMLLGEGRHQTEAVIEKHLWIEIEERFFKKVPVQQCIRLVLEINLFLFQTSIQTEFFKNY